MDWAGLPGDLLTCIGALLAVPSRICFRAVCRTWRAAINGQQAGAMPPPWVVIPRGAGYMSYSDSFTVLSAPTMNSFQWKPPGGVRALCVGSNGGWLAVVTSADGKEVAISLVNPLTDARVELPPVTGWLLHARPQDLAYALDNVVSKVAFAPSPSAQEYAVAYVSRCDRSVEYSRVGIRGEVDVAYRDGKFYYMDWRGQVWVVAIDMAAPSPSPAPLAVFPPPVPGIVYLTRGCHLAFSIYQLVLIP